MSKEKLLNSYNRKNDEFYTLYFILFTIDDKKNYLSTRNCENGKYQCEICHKWFYPEELQMDHIEAWSKGGRTVLSNAQVLCAPCNRKKSNF